MWTAGARTHEEEKILDDGGGGLPDIMNLRGERGRPSNTNAFVGNKQQVERTSWLKVRPKS